MNFKQKAEFFGRICAICGHRCGLHLEILNQCDGCFKENPDYQHHEFKCKEQGK